MHFWARVAFRPSDNEPTEATNATMAPLVAAAEWGKFSPNHQLRHDKCGSIGSIG